MKFYKQEEGEDIVQIIKKEEIENKQGYIEMIPNQEEAAEEKHIPVVALDDNVIDVRVGSVEHPMQEEHYIQWICLETDKGMQLQYKNPGEEPRAVFVVNEQKPIAVYAYCNKHGLWKTEIV